MDNFEDVMSHQNSDVILPNENEKTPINNESNNAIVNEMITCEDPNESSLLNSIVEAVMRGDMNEVVSLALSHRNTDSKDRGIVDQALSTALRNKFRCDQIKELEKEIHCESKTELAEKEDNLTEHKTDSTNEPSVANSVYSTTMKSDEDNEIQCSYYIDSNSVLESNKNNIYCQSGFSNQNIEFENHTDDHVNGNFAQYQTTTSSFQKYDGANSMKHSQQSVQVQLPGIGNFLLQLPSNFKPGEPITLPISLPLTPASSQTSAGNPISINMNTGQIISNQLLSLYNPTTCINTMSMGKKMRAIAPKPSKPSYRQPLIAPKTDSPNVSTFNQDCANASSNSTPLPAPSGPGRRKGTKGKKVGRKRGAPPKPRKDSSYASSTHSIDSQDTIQFNDSNNPMKQNCNNYNISSRNTYQCNYFVNSDTSDYINQSHAVPQSYSELQTNNLLDTSDSGEKDLLSLAWEISNADLGNNDDFGTTYQLYDGNNMGSENFVSSEILDQFLQNIQKDDLSDLSRCSSTQINLDPRVSYASSFTTLPPCSTVLPSVTTSNYPNNSSNNHQSNLELSNCIEIAEVVNLNTEDMLSELEKDENALLDKFVAQYSSGSTDRIQQAGLLKYRNQESDVNSMENKTDYSEKDLDPNVKESNELSEIAKQIEKDCDVSNMGNSSITRNYLTNEDYDYQKEIERLNKSNVGIINRNRETYLATDSGNFCRQVPTPLDLIYSTTTDSFNSTVIDVKNHYVMSVNVDTKIQNEATYYISNGSLKSKTLDDFGLLDFCTESGENQYNDADCLDDKRYLEPPILEDISDASPIPSDEESVDEDIDLCAFKLSSFNHMTLLSNRLYRNRTGNLDHFWNASKMNDLLTLLDTSQLESQSFSSDKWYTNNSYVTLTDGFLDLDHKKILEEEYNNADKKGNSENEDQNEIKNIIDQNETNHIDISNRSTKQGKNNIKDVLVNRKSKALRNQKKDESSSTNSKQTFFGKIKRNLRKSTNLDNRNSNDDHMIMQNNMENSNVNTRLTKHQRLTRNLKKSLTESIKIINSENENISFVELNEEDKESTIIKPTGNRKLKRNVKNYSKEDDTLELESCSNDQVNFTRICVQVKATKHREVKRHVNNLSYKENELNNADDDEIHSQYKDTDNNTESTKDDFGKINIDHSKHNEIEGKNVEFGHLNSTMEPEYKVQVDNEMKMLIIHDDNEDSKVCALIEANKANINNVNEKGITEIMCEQNEVGNIVDGVIENCGDLNLKNKDEHFSTSFVQTIHICENSLSINETVTTDDVEVNCYNEQENGIDFHEKEISKTPDYLNKQLETIDFKDLSEQEEIHLCIDQTEQMVIQSNVVDEIKYIDNDLNDSNKFSENDDLSDHIKCQEISSSVELIQSGIIKNMENITTSLIGGSYQNDKEEIDNTSILIENKSNNSSVVIDQLKHRKVKKNINKDKDCDIYNLISNSYIERNIKSRNSSKEEHCQTDIYLSGQHNGNAEPKRHGMVKKNKNNTLNDLESCYFEERKSRLRKPPMKLAIYHSIKFIENEFSAKGPSESNSSKYLNTQKFKKEAEKSVNNSKINHCTRSKGLISKSFDAFYETLEKSKRNQHPKIKVINHNLTNKKKYKCNVVQNDIKNNDLKPIHRISTNSIESKEKNIVKTLVNKKSINILNEGIIHKSFISLKAKQSRKISNVSKKYNLRHHSVENHKNSKSIHEKKSRNENFKNETIKLKPGRPKEKIITELNQEKVKENILQLYESYTAENVEVDNQFVIFTKPNFFTEDKVEPVQDNGSEFHKASVNVTQVLSCNITESIKPKESYKKSFPVRKINRKLRLLSGLEYENHVNHCTILELENFDFLKEFSLDVKALKFLIYPKMLLSGSNCKYLRNIELRSEIDYQVFEDNEEDFDDADSCDARLVIVENEDILTHTSKTINIENIDNAVNIINETDINFNKELVEYKEIDISKRYSLRNKPKDGDILCDTSIPIKRQSIKRFCKKIENSQLENVPENQYIEEHDFFIKSTVNDSFCSIKSITKDNIDKDSLLEANTLIEYQIVRENDNNVPNEIELQECENNLQQYPDEKIINNQIVCEDYHKTTNEIKSQDIEENSHRYDEEQIINVQTKDQIALRILKRIKENKLKLRVYRNHVKIIWKTKLKKDTNYKLKLKKKFQIKKMFEKNDTEENLTLIENGISKINFESEDLNKYCELNENDYVEVTDDVPDNKLCTIVDSNNMETFSRSYGSFSLKIKFQKQNPAELQEQKQRVRKRKKSSKKRKKLRHFLNSIMSTKESRYNKSNSGYESLDEESNYDGYNNSRKRKHSSTTICSIDSSNQENISQNDKPPKLTPETLVIDDDNFEDEHPKPIKIKLFKSTNDDCSKSEEMIFSLQKSNSKDVKEKPAVPKMLQVLKDQQFKPCRQAANLAKKKIFSTAKEDRRSQNATLASIWNPRKINNALNKLPTDFLNRCNDRRRRPRGRPPKSNHLSVFSDKYMSTSGTLKLKIKLSKDFKNCNDDNMSSNGENSGRTSTNDSSILNSAVAGINGPSDALSLESNNFINGITQQLDENIDYLEAKEAKVYFDPNQVDIEKIKNSYYSSKKNNSIHFDGTSQHNMYDDSSSEICDEKKNTLSNSQEFSNYNDNDSAAPYNYPCNNKISHLPKELINNVSENCYNPLSVNREPQDLSQSNQPYSFNNQISSPGKNQFDLWHSTKDNSAELLSTCRNGNNTWFPKHRSFPNSNSIYDSYVNSNSKETKSCNLQNQNSPFMLCENETSDPKAVEISLAKQSSNKEGRKSSNNSFESHSQLSPNQSRGGIGSVPSQLNIHNWSDEQNHNTSLNHTAAAWMTYAQQQAAAAAYIDPQMKAYYNLALSQSMLNNPYCGAYGNPSGNPDNFYSSLHSQYLSNSKELMEKNHANSTIRNHNDTMGTFMEAAQISSWEHFYSAAAMAGYHNTSQGAMDEYAGRAGNMLQAHHMLAGGYPGSVLTRDHFPIDPINKPPVAHQNQSGSTSPMKPITSPTPISSAPQAYSHVQMPYSHFNGTPVGFF